MNLHGATVRQPRRFSATAWGVVSGVSTLAVMLVGGEQLGTGPLAVIFMYGSAGLMAITSGAVMKVAEHFDLIALPYRESVLGLSEKLREGVFPPTRRGGWRHSLKFWPTQRVFAHYALVLDFLTRVAGVEPYQCFISDGLTLWDLHGGPSNLPFFVRTYQVYGVDISDIDPPYVCAIAERIHERWPN